MDYPHLGCILLSDTKKAGVEAKCARDSSSDKRKLRVLRYERRYTAKNRPHKGEEAAGAVLYWD
jgi:hypothetical protein